ncbi:MAG: hypothetical protein QOC56_1888 [Alphaproteobacteria bacterium]|jgi:hypothetical protein|nr:hypothetical protein [Alphaproteobacteria bacterium]
MAADDDAAWADWKNALKSLKLAVDEYADVCELPATDPTVQKAWADVKQAQAELGRAASNIAPAGATA